MKDRERESQHESVTEVDPDVLEHFRRVMVSTPITPQNVHINDIHPSLRPFVR